MHRNINTKDLFGNKVRVRVCGLLFKNDKILLVRHKIDEDILWAPPGGGVQFGETVEDALVREFKEETNLKIIPGKFLFFTEHIERPLHALELFFEVRSATGILKPGTDPEVSHENVITDLRYFGRCDIKDTASSNLHMIFKICTNPIELLDKRGQMK